MVLRHEVAVLRVQSPGPSTTGTARTSPASNDRPTTTTKPAFR